MDNMWIPSVSDTPTQFPLAWPIVGHISLFLIDLYSLQRSSQSLHRCQLLLPAL